MGHDPFAGPGALATAMLETPVVGDFLGFAGGVAGHVHSSGKARVDAQLGRFPGAHPAPLTKADPFSAQGRFAGANPLNWTAGAWLTLAAIGLGVVAVVTVGAIAVTAGREIVVRKVVG